MWEIIFLGKEGKKMKNDKYLETEPISKNDLTSEEKSSEDRQNKIGKDELISDAKKGHFKKKKIIVGSIAGLLIIVLIALGIWNHQQHLEVQKIVELGQKYLDQENYEEAKTIFDKALAINDKKIEAYEGKGDAYIGLKDFDRAEEQVKKAQEIEKNAYNIVQMANVFVNTDRTDEAKVMVKEIKNIEKEKTKVVIRAAHVLIDTEDYESAIKMLDNKISNTTDENELIKLFDEMVDVYIVAGKSEDEILDLLQRASKKTGNTAYLDQKEEVIVKLPSFESAGGEYEKAVTVTIKKGNDSDKVYYTLDGSDPSNQSSEYTKPFVLGPGNHMVKAIEYNKHGTKGKIQEVEYTVKIDPEEAFIDNIRGKWITRYDGPDASAIYEDSFTFSEDTFSNMTGKRGTGEGCGGKYRIISVNADGTKGTIELYDQSGPLTFANTTIVIDCGEMGDGVIRIGKADYSYCGN